MVKMIIMGGISLQLLHVLVVLFLLMKPVFTSRFQDAGVGCIENEKQALLALKQGLVDDYGRLSSWGTENENRDCCKWIGVRCDNQSGHVVMLNLQPPKDFKPLRGKITSSLLELQRLNYLDLSNNDFQQSGIPKDIGGLTNLRYLDLSNANFSGTIPYQLANLSRLQFLDLNYNFLFPVQNLQWLSHLSSLEYLDLGGVHLSKANDWLQVVTRLPHLRSLFLNCSNLHSIIPESLSIINASTSLTHLGLSHNYLTSSIYRWLFNFSSSIVDLNLAGNLLNGSIPHTFGTMTSLSFLDLSSNQLRGSIPVAFGNMTSLSYLDLNSNQLAQGGVPMFFGSLCNLRILFLHWNSFSLPFSGFIQNLSGCVEDSLEVLYIGGNQITGSLSNLTRFSSLRVLSLGINLLNGTLPESIGNLTKLEVLDVSWNFLEGVISETHLSNLFKLQRLDLAFNSLALDFRSDWTPPFQLDIISLGSCKLGPGFPEWLLTQNRYSVLDISGAEISDSVPSSFWDLSPDLHYLNVSYNQIKGPIANSSKIFTGFPDIDLSSNYFEGPVPSFLSKVTVLNLSKNKFSGSISFLCATTHGQLRFLDVSANNLSAELPNCWMHMENLVILDLSNNNFSGKIPNSMGFLHGIETLQLRNNNLIGELPLSLKNCTELTYIDLAENKFSGALPAWIGVTLSKLVVLILQSNQFHGSMPPTLCHLSHLQLLDLSMNDISGNIPKCLDNLTAMAQKGSKSATILHKYSFYVSQWGVPHSIYDDSAFLAWKGRVFEFSQILGFVKGIDLSSNILYGEVPENLMNLAGLVFLNLSRNSLTGEISPKIGQLTSLDALDLSRNQLYGEIPTSLSQLDRLSFLDLSNNNLSGKIPTGTQLQSFNASAYAKNHGLCGAPLPNECKREQQTQNSHGHGDQEDKDGLITLGFYVSIALGFAVGFWGVCGTLLGYL